MLSWLNEYSSAIQAFNAIAIVILTIVLVVVTYWQSRTAKEAFLVATKRFALEWHPELYAEAVVLATGDAFKVTNLGRSTALLLKLILSSKLRAEQSSFESRYERIIGPGESTQVLITKALRAYFQETEGTYTPGRRSELKISFSFYAGGTIRCTKWFDFVVGPNESLILED